MFLQVSISDFTLLHYEHWEQNPKVIQNCVSMFCVGFNSILRRGCITYHEYLQVGKGRDVGINQISKFEAKVANGNSEQTVSRDIYRLACQFDFFRMLSCYFTTIGFYFSSLVIPLTYISFFFTFFLFFPLSRCWKVVQVIMQTRIHTIGFW